MARPSSILARPAAIPASAGLRLGRLLNLPEAPFATLAAPCGDGQFLASLTAGPGALTASTINLLSARCEAATAYGLSSTATSALIIVGLKKPTPGLDPAVRDALAEARAGQRRSCPPGRLPPTQCPPGATYRSSD